jgi:hypothetical protein
MADRCRNLAFALIKTRDLPLSVSAARKTYSSTPVARFCSRSARSRPTTARSERLSLLKSPTVSPGCYFSPVAREIKMAGLSVQACSRARSIRSLIPIVFLPACSPSHKFETVHATVCEWSRRGSLMPRKSGLQTGRSLVIRLPLWRLNPNRPVPR